MSKQDKLDRERIRCNYCGQRLLLDETGQLCRSCALWLADLRSGRRCDVEILLAHLKLDVDYIPECLARGAELQHVHRDEFVSDLIRALNDVCDFLRYSYAPHEMSEADLAKCLLCGAARGSSGAPSKSRQPFVCGMCENAPFFLGHLPPSLIDSDLRDLASILLRTRSVIRHLERVSSDYVRSPDADALLSAIELQLVTLRQSLSG